MFDKMTKEDWLFGASEELAELQQALSKVYRSLTGRNKTPLTHNEAVKMMVEEIADCEWYIDKLIDVFGIDRRLVMREYASKEVRAHERLDKVDMH